MSDNRKVPKREFEAVGVSLHYGVWEIQWRVDGFEHRAWLPMCATECEAKEKLQRYVARRNGDDVAKGESWTLPQS